MSNILLILFPSQLFEYEYIKNITITTAKPIIIILNNKLLFLPGIFLIDELLEDIIL